MKVKILIIMLLAFGLFMCRKPAAYFYNEGSIYGTIYHVIYESPKGEDFHDELKEKLNEYNMIFSTYDPASQISKVNNNQPVEPDELFIRCFKRSMEISKLTDGAFDITAGSMVNAWGFGPETKAKMTPDKIDSLKQITGYRKVKLTDGRIEKEHHGIKLDMSAIAKGFTCDLLAQFLDKQGCNNYMIEIGGEVVAKGINEKGRTWTIGISRPDEMAFLGSTDIEAKVKLPGQALATSGNYRNYYVEDGKKYAHTIDPSTGYPVQHSLLSTTVIADSCIDADAFATAFMVMGLEKSIEVANKIAGLKVYFIYSGNEGEHLYYVSENFKENLSDL